MNEELQSTLASLLEKSMEVAEKTGQWALDIAPELIEQYLMWEFWSSAFIVGIAILYLIPSCKIFPYTIEVWTNVLDYSEFQGVATLLYCCGTIFAFIALIVNAYTMVFIKVAPEIYLIKNLL